MKLSIQAGTLILSSMDGGVHVIVYPRRSVDAAPTRADLRAEPMPALTLHPESILEVTSAEAWVWDGSPAKAHVIAPLVLEAIRKRLRPTGSVSPRAQAWRARVLESLFPGHVDRPEDVVAPQQA